MRRTAVLSLAAGVLVAFAWFRLEGPTSGGRPALLIALAVLPALLRRTRWRLAAAALAFVGAAAVAFDGSPFTAWDRAGTGVRSFYDVALPFDPEAHAHMHGLVLLAIFIFTAAIALAVAERRAIAAAALFVAGAGWPATLVPGRAELAQGALILAGALVLLAAVRTRSPARLGKVVAASGAVVAAALVAASFPAVARDQIVGWETWDPYARADPAVGVQYVWDSSYTGFDFPDEPTNLLEIAGPANPTYWRATTLDIYRNGHWLEDPDPTDVNETSERAELTLDSDLPPAARREQAWIEQQVRVNALRDTHLVGAPIPVAFAADADLEFSEGGIAEVAGGMPRGFEYTVWSYSASPLPSRLAETPPEYEPEVSTAKFLEVERDVVAPPFGAANRHAQMLELVRSDGGIGRYESLYELARRVGEAATPYGAVVKLETWFRTNEEFVYEEQPPRTPPGIPPLVDFVTRTREGYCQHYAGAMTLMLRYLGVPARVAAGFTSGSYDGERRLWTVTDRNAHTWVEVWFRGFGWLPFDPTPGRGRLAGAYTSSSLGFRDREVLEALGEEGGALGALGRQSIQRLGLLLARERRNEGAAGASGGSGGDNGRADVTGVVLLFVALGGASAIAGTKFVRRRLRYVGGGARQIAGAARQELSDFARDQRVDVRPAATLEELGEKVRSALSVDARRFVAVASAARFGPDAEAPEAARRARAELRLLKRAIRARLSTGRRLRGLVSLRSLRA
jgi:transglutaminase-like putative cysteine protease